MFSPSILWHVNCDHFSENGCYGCESANNENASGDSGLRRSHPTSSSTPPARSISHPIALARNPRHRHETDTDYRSRYARPPRHCASCEDHTCAADADASRTSPGGCRCSGGVIAGPSPSAPLHRGFFQFSTSRLIEDRARESLAKFEAVINAALRLLEFDLKSQLLKEVF